MKSLVITIIDNVKSDECANRCIKSAKSFGQTVEKWQAITPETVTDYFIDNGIPKEPFLNNQYSKIKNVMACFASHHSLWKHCIDIGEEVLVLEHDAFFISRVPEEALYDYAISFGKPSYGKYRLPPNIGTNTLTSKPHFPGAHAYMIKPAAAKKFIEVSKKHPMPADVFLCTKLFPWLQEYMPWCVEARDTFSTVQEVRGCVAKHNYDDNYELIDP